MTGAADAHLDTAIHALLQRVTAEAIMPRYRNLASGEVEDKGGNDPVTVADKDSEKLLREGLAELDDSLAFVGEETAHADPSILDRLDQPCWIVDPIDGTRNFASGKPPFGIIVARADGGVARSGWIYDCLTGRFCTAHLGSGAFVDGERIAARPTGKSPPVAALSLIFMQETRREAT
ncbi:MAG: inositol monophosphatase family protein, partial [Pseudomonadota bacterium]|nr:inositol monophosphatase family protein [Pseudomonadota bacterium]